MWKCQISDYYSEERLDGWDSREPWQSSTHNNESLNTLIFNPKQTPRAHLHRNVCVCVGGGIPVCVPLLRCVLISVSPVTKHTVNWEPHHNLTADPAETQTRHIFTSFMFQLIIYFLLITAASMEALSLTKGSWSRSVLLNLATVTSLKRHSNAFYFEDLNTANKHWKQLSQSSGSCTALG